MEAETANFNVGLASYLRTPFPCILAGQNVLRVFLILVAVGAPAHGQMFGRDGSPLTSNLHICNQGSNAFDVATTRFYKGTVLDVSGHELISEGWWTIQPGQCSSVYASYLSDYVFLGFVQWDQNRAPWGGVFEIDGNGPYGYRSADRSFCVKRDKFAYRGTADELSEACARDPAYLLLPYSVYFQADPRRSGYYTLNVDLDNNARLVPLRQGASSSGRSASSPPARVPKPGENGTLNAMLRGKKIVRWIDGEGRWYWENGTPLADGLHLTGKKFSQLFDAQVAYSQLPETVNALRGAIRDSLSPKGYVKVTLNGELGVLNDKLLMVRTNLTSLDLSQARAFEREHGGADIKIDCARRDECVMADGPEGTYALSFLALRFKTLDGAKSGIAAIRELAALFKNPRYLVETVTGPPEP